VRLQRRVRRMTERVAKDSKVPVAAAATASTAAVACGVCCVLPFALPAALAGSLGGVFAVFERAFPWMRWAAIIAVAAGWLWVLWQSKQTSKRPSASTLLVMAFATAALAVATMWPMLEEPLIRMLR
jgi:hypothetical protein